MTDLKDMFARFDALPEDEQNLILKNPKGYRTADFSPIDPDESPVVAAARFLLAEQKAMKK